MAAAEATYHRVSQEAGLLQHDRFGLLQEGWPDNNKPAKQSFQHHFKRHRLTTALQMMKMLVIEHLGVLDAEDHRLAQLSVALIRLLINKKKSASYAKLGHVQTRAHAHHVPMAATRRTVQQADTLQQSPEDPKLRPALHDRVARGFQGNVSVKWTLECRHPSGSWSHRHLRRAVLERQTALRCHAQVLLELVLKVVAGRRHHHTIAEVFFPGLRQEDPLRLHRANHRLRFSTHLRRR